MRPECIETLIQNNKIIKFDYLNKKYMIFKKINNGKINIYLNNIIFDYSEDLLEYKIGKLTIEHILTILPDKAFNVSRLECFISLIMGNREIEFDYLGKRYSAIYVNDRKDYICFGEFYKKHYYFETCEKLLTHKIDNITLKKYFLNLMIIR